jgi:copper chaperone CopZ
MNIDGELEDTAGVTEASTNYAKQETRVVYDPTLIEPNKIAEIISGVGYSATLI